MGQWNCGLYTLFIPTYTSYWTKINPIPSKWKILFQRWRGYFLSYSPNQNDIFTNFYVCMLLHDCVNEDCDNTCITYAFKQFNLMNCLCYFAFASCFSHLILLPYVLLIPLCIYIVFCYTHCSILHEVFLLQNVILISYS
jgi:hypothetical protein